jgi:transcriptional regulator with XRE-family HTH domain
MSKTDWAGALKTARLKLGESQEIFARRFMVTTNTVSRWETGDYRLSIEALEWVMDYALKREVRVCPRCAGKGVVNEIVGDVTKKEVKK